ncbi:hypothetical protein B0A50_03721 [Salinomyces thailandicus]|uniref:Uncharacterized protein n=1 Tax=Salinomyces thailandicus TaxID=706561 RepID=A0A4U0U2J5_9PEZI|nr:hypothetical protein B0A50_03721 [Salinomyces thailandica]
MAEAFSSKTIAEQSEPEDDGRRTSTSTTSKRNSYYDQQRTGRRSRPVSGSSQLTSKSKGKRASYQLPPDIANLDEVAIPPPAGPSRQDSLEQARAQQASPKPGGETRNSHRPGPARRPTRDTPQDYGLSELAAPPPIKPPEEQPENPPDASTAAGPTGRLLDDAEDADSESLTAPSPWVQRRPEDYLPKEKPPREIPRPLAELYTICYLIFFSIMGTLARLGVQWLTFYPGAPIVTPVIWANFGGSLFMGFLSEDQGLFRDAWNQPPTTPEKLHDNTRRANPSDLERLNKAERGKLKKTIPLYIGLATGFCGSFTSFSSFARDFFLALSNDLPSPINHPNAFNSPTSPSPTSTTPRQPGYSFEAWTAVVLTTLALSLGGLLAGAHLALFLHPLTPRIPRKLTRNFLDPLILLLGPGVWLAAVLLAIWPPDRPSGPASRPTETWRGQVLFALVFAPLGCLLRFYASLHLNGLIPSFPLGTFAVNMLGTAIQGMSYDIQHVRVGLMGRVGGGRYVGGGD